MDYLKSKESLEEFIDEYENMVEGILPKDRSMVLIKSGEVFIEWAKVIQTMLADFNHIKYLLDCAYSNKDVEEFEKQHKKLSILLAENNFTTMMQRVKSRKRWYKMISPLQKKISNQIAFMKRARDGGAKYIKRSKMSPAQQEAADKASKRMSEQWGMV